jgi:hypothetical protein
MPRKNGLQVIESTRKFIKDYNDNAEHIVQVKEPIFVFLTAFKTKAFLNYVSKLEIGGVYEKPLGRE